MRKIYLFISIFQLIGQCFFAQSNTADSLFSVLKSQKEDTSKVNTLYAIAYELRGVDPDTALFFAKKSLGLATKLNYKVGEADAWLCIGFAEAVKGEYAHAETHIDIALKIYDGLPTQLINEAQTRHHVILQKGKAYNVLGSIALNTGHFDEALRTNFIALKLRCSVNDRKGVSLCYYNIGNVCCNEGNYQKALKFYFSAMQVSKHINDAEGIGNAFDAIGSVYAQQGNYPEALKNMYAALRIMDKLGDKAGAAISYNNIGIIYYYQKDYARALKNWFTSLKLREELKDRVGIAASYMNIGNVYSDQGNNVEALQNYSDYLEIMKESGNKYESSLVYGNIGNIYLILNNYPSALENYFEALRLSEKIGDKIGVIRASHGIGKTFTKQKKYDLARKNLDKGLTLAKEIGSIPEIQISYGNLGYLDSAQADFKGAFQNYKQYILYRDSLVNEENTRKTVEERMQYQFDKKISFSKAEQDKKDIIVAETFKRQRLLRNSFIAGIILLILTMIIVIRNIQRRKLQEKQAAQLKTMIDTQESERRRISRDLHDDIGTKLSALGLFLSSMKEHAYESGNTEIITLANSSQQFVKEAVSDLRELLLDLSPSVLEDFGYTVAIEGLVNKINETKLIHFNLIVFGLKGRLNLNYELALYRITQELVNNVIKHADANKVTLQIGRRENLIILIIEDNGKGFELNQYQEGYGLKNLSSRTALLQGKMTIDTAPGKGTSVLIEIPYKD